MRLREVDVVVVTVTYNGDLCLVLVVCKEHGVSVATCLLRCEFEDQLLCLAHFQDAFSFIKLESVRHFNMPLSCLFTNVTNHYRLFSGMLYWHRPEVNAIREVQVGSAAHRADRNYELLSLCYNGQIVRVIYLSFGREPDDVLNFHAGGDTAAHNVDVCACLGGAGGAALEFLVRDDFEELRVGGYYLD
jgi:hypothetical protein